MLHLVGTQESPQSDRDPRFSEGRWLGYLLVAMLGICAVILTFTAIFGGGELIGKIFAVVFLTILGLAVLAAIASATFWRKIVVARRRH